MKRVEYSPDTPRLIPSVVLYLDLLGSREMAMSAQAQQHLQRLHKALDEARDFGLHRTNLDYPTYSLATFTDHIALGWPMQGDGEAQLGPITGEAAYYQFALARRGFLARGGIEIGNSYFGKDFAFGRALIEAYKLESKKAIHPRIVLGDNALALIQLHGRYYGGVDHSPYGHVLLVDEEDTVFVNYLSVINDEEMNGTIEYDTQKRLIEDGLQKHQTDDHILGKYLWLADLYNFTNQNWHTPRSIPAAPGRHRFHNLSHYLG